MGLSLALGLSGCASYLAPFETSRAYPGVPTPATDALRALPTPAEPVVVAVYRFRDQTGQYKALENVSTFSTQVTQGATSILVRALEASGWFVPIEREGLSNLLNERQIISAVRAQYAGPDGDELPPLPPLLYAGVLLEGGIIGYDTNVITAGAGARYFATGGSAQIRQDQVTIYLRAVSTQTGRVLKTVHVTKTLLSQQMEGGLFRFVDQQRLLEAEAGYSFNEPPVQAVTEAIEDAVRALVIEGVRENLWALQNPGDLTQHPAFAAYDAERAAAEQVDVFGRRRKTQRRGVGLGLALAGTKYEGDFADPLLRPQGEGFLRYTLTPHFALGSLAGYGEIGARDAFTTAQVDLGLHGLYYAIPDGPVTPFLLAGAGVLIQPEPVGAVEGPFPYLTAGVGLEWMATPRLAFDLFLTNEYPLVEGIDGVETGPVNDNVWLFKVGVVRYLRP